MNRRHLMMAGVAAGAAAAGLGSAWWRLRPGEGMAANSDEVHALWSMAHADLPAVIQAMQH